MWGDRVIVERKEYLEKLIKIVTGVRRCGNNVKLRIM